MRELRATTGLAALALVWSVAASSAAAQAPALRQADAPAAQLERSDVSELPGGAVASRFEQEVAGIPVTGAGAIVLDEPGEPAELLVDESVEGIEAPGDPAVSRAAAMTAALAAIGPPRGGTTTARLVIDATRGNQLAWEVVHYDSYSDWLVTVSASSGDVIGREDRLLHATGQAKLFVPNAVVANDGYQELRDRNDRDTRKLTKLRTPVLLGEIDDGQSCLTGTWAHVRLGDAEKEVCKGSLNWNGITRSKSKFEALMAYHHVTGIQEHIQSLGITGANDESQALFADVTMPPSLGQDNSFYAPSRDEIRFGRGGVDDAEDADVIVHEYGHAVQHAQAPGSFDKNQGGAMGEGFGDYLAGAYSTERVGFDAEWTPCIMEWDATAYDSGGPNGICLRRADDPDTWPIQRGECGGPREIHCVGQVWSSALLELRAELGDDGGGDSIMDTLVLASHELIAGQATFESASEAILDADGTIYGGANCGDLADEFGDRGFGTFAC